ncbi:histidine phosphatase family protein [Alkanindiges sp. WGS2144]|uniref:histidine phosphatase family protein n=1 Tax=Alkanindiges sp. WGS2144 TaxID=3366808 RepID=UPI003753D995
MTLITLIRHGQASFGATNYDQLSPRGYEQARFLGELFAGQQQTFDQAWMGEMARHQQTADHCLNAAGLILNPAVHQGLNEFDHEQVLMNLDTARYPTKEALIQAIAATDHPKKTLGKLFGEAMQRWQCGEYDCDYSETWQQFQVRCVTALNDIVAQSTTKHSVVFSSGGVISVMVQNLLGLDNRATFELNWALINCGVTRIRSENGKHTVLSINEQQHFYGQHSDLLTWH